ncbi:hypothetical protein B0T20DRAFT_471436 [Sordaria brevicollis]|uniref:Uncharacterized protein n=1 Tax=Sordaria brevicollis TaxID=83679 RepID=A0AAE0UA56_SORBR|nr:hypothetical protein B0T20DRAFT_471436 [Sordaria brevicollis]
MYLMALLGSLAFPPSGPGWGGGVGIARKLAKCVHEDVDGAPLGAARGVGAGFWRRLGEEWRPEMVVEKVDLRAPAGPVHVLFQIDTARTLSFIVRNWGIDAGKGSHIRRRIRFSTYTIGGLVKAGYPADAGYHNLDRIAAVVQLLPKHDQTADFEREPPSKCVRDFQRQSGRAIPWQAYAAMSVTRFNNGVADTKITRSAEDQRAECIPEAWEPERPSMLSIKCVSPPKAQATKSPGLIFHPYVKARLYLTIWGSWEASSKPG